MMRYIRVSIQFSGFYMISIASYMLHNIVIYRVVLSCHKEECW